MQWLRPGAGFTVLRLRGVAWALRHSPKQSYVRVQRRLRLQTEVQRSSAVINKVVLVGRGVSG